MELLNVYVVYTHLYTCIQLCMCVRACVLSRDSTKARGRYQVSPLIPVCFIPLRRVSTEPGILKTTVTTRSWPLLCWG